MLSAFNRPLASGLREPHHCRRGRGQDKGDLPRFCDATPKISQPQRSNLPCRFPKTLGVKSHGGKARMKISALASLRFEFDLLIATIGARRHMGKSGFLL